MNALDKADEGNQGFERYHGAILKQVKACSGEGLFSVEGALLWQRVPVRSHDHIPLLVDLPFLQQPQCILLQPHQRSGNQVCMRRT